MLSLQLGLHKYPFPQCWRMKELEVQLWQVQLWPSWRLTQCRVAFFLILFLFIYCWLCWVFAGAQVFSSCGEQRLLSSWCAASHCSGFSCCRAWALCGQTSIVVACGLSSCDSWSLEHKLTIVAHGLSCFAACGIFRDWALNLCLLHWQADSLSLSHQGSPQHGVLNRRDIL